MMQDASFEAITRKNLRAIVAAYVKGRQTTVPKASKKFYGNNEFLGLFFSGKHSVSLKKLDEMLAAIRADWPEKVKWPFCKGIFLRPPAIKKS